MVTTAKGVMSSPLECHTTAVSQSHGVMDSDHYTGRTARLAEPLLQTSGDDVEAAATDDLASKALLNNNSEAFKSRAFNVVLVLILAMFWTLAVTRFGAAFAICDTGCCSSLPCTSSTQTALPATGTRYPSKRGPVHCPAGSWE